MEKSVIERIKMKIQSKPRLQQGAVSGSYSAPFCKACKYWTIIDVLGGEYCTLIKECVASPRPEYKHKDCPL